MVSPVEPIDSRRYEASGLLVRERHYPRGFVLEPHEHFADVVSLALQGTWREKCDVHRIDRREGQVQVLPSGARHTSVFGSGPARVLLVELSPTWEHYGDRIARRIAEPVTLRGNTAAARVARRLALVLARRGEPETEEIVLQLVEALGRLRPSRSSAPPGWLMRAREHLDDCFLRPPAIAELAAACGVRAGSLARAFAHHYGCTASEHVRRRRIEWALNELTRSDRPIARIALEAGYSDQAHFTRACRRSTGMAPGALRRSRITRSAS